MVGSSSSSRSGSPDERARQQHAAAPAAGQRRDAGAGGEVESREHLLHARLALPLVVAEVAEAFGHHIEHRTRVLEQHVLREAADAQRRLPPDAAAVGLQLAADDAEQRRLAGAVATDDADTFARLNLQARVVQQRQVSVRERDVVEGDEGHPIALGRVLANGRQEDLAEVVGLARADTFHGAERVDGGRSKAGHLTKRRVVKDHVRRHATLARGLEPHRAKPLEQLAVDVFPRLRLDARRVFAARPCAR